MPTWLVILLFALANAVVAGIFYFWLYQQAYESGYFAGRIAGIGARPDGVVERLLGRMEGYATGYLAGRAEKIDKVQNEALYKILRNVN